MKKTLPKIIVLLVGLIAIIGLCKARTAANIKAEATPEPTPVPVVATAALEPTATPEPTPEPEPEFFTLSFIGDNTLWSNQNFVYSDVGLPLTVGEDYAYPYSNTVQYFTEDEYTLANLECTLSDRDMYSSGEVFSFKCPSAFVNILVEGGVDFVTMANNHTMDYYEQGRDDTCEALDSVGIPHVNEDEHIIVETPNGLKLGVYSCYNTYHPEDKWDSCEAAIKEMRSDGADIVICMFHWGQELYYTPNENQVDMAHRCIDAGADIVYGSHPHCLQPIEEYNGKLILYSMGNWVFGGSTAPKDCDTAIVQAIIKRDVDGTICYDSFKAIPCAVSSNLDGANAKSDNYNDYKPTPWPEDNEGYARTLSKLQGTFEATSQGADYSNYYAQWG